MTDTDKMARVLYAYPSVADWGKAGTDIREFYQGMARAAIAALMDEGWLPPDEAAPLTIEDVEAMTGITDAMRGIKP